MTWHFSELPAGQVETEITQRDHFNNDAVDLGDTLVREAIQNSLDAGIEESKPIKVTFRWITSKNGLSTKFVKLLLEGQLEHARAAGLDMDAIDLANPTALVIEDFGTKGLTGSTDQWDDSNFSDFWRRHGKSHKSGRSRGRWGLGKLVYSTCSQLGVFFGLTCREPENTPFLMGQTVLNLRTIGEKRYPPHGFFSDLEHEGDLYKQMPVPIKDKTLVHRFITEFDLRRNNQSGLSIVSLFPDPEFDKEKMAGKAIGSYFYSVITGRLKLAFDDISINHNNVRELANQYAKSHFDQIDLLFNFIDDVYMTGEANLPQLNESWAKDSKLGENDLTAELLESLKEKFANGELVGLSLPLKITYRDGKSFISKFSVFLKRPENLEKGRDMYVRGGLTVPEESKFNERKALGIMIAEDVHICGLLGDAENAAHTKWTTRTEKLTNNFRGSERLVTSIKKSLIGFYDLLVDEVEETDERALRDFFPFNEEQKSNEDPNGSSTPPTPSLPSRPSMFSINRITGGFTVQATEHLEDNGQFPVILNIQVAYDVARGNPYTKYSPLDFDMSQNGNIMAQCQPSNSIIQSQNNNQVSIKVNDTEFKIECTGFDPHRDIRIRLTTEDT